MNTQEQFVKEAADRIRSVISRTMQDIIAIGRDLIAVKKRVGHGNFLPWIRKEFGMSDQAARRFMQVAANMGDQIQHNVEFEPTVLYALAAPSTPPEVRTEVIERAKAGKAVTVSEVRALKNAKASKTRKGKQSPTKPAAVSRRTPHRNESDLRGRTDNSKDSVCERVVGSITTLDGLPAAHEVVDWLSDNDFEVLIAGDRAGVALQWLTDFFRALRRWEARQEQERANAEEIIAPPTAPIDDAATCPADDYVAQVQRAEADGGIPDFLDRRDKAHATAEVEPQKFAKQSCIDGTEEKKSAR